MEFFFSTIFKDKDSNYQEIVLSWTALFMRSKTTPSQKKTDCKTNYLMENNNGELISRKEEKNKINFQHTILRN